MDITYIQMKKGFKYLTALIDLYSRHVVGWSISNNMDAEWCKEVLEEAVSQYGCPKILNTDQGSQFTSEVFTSTVKSNDICLSMDGKGRAIDNVFIERFWRTIKYEKVYLNLPQDGLDLYKQIAEYMNYHNNRRRHSSLKNQIPAEVYSMVKQVA